MENEKKGKLSEELKTPLDIHNQRGAVESKASEIVTPCCGKTINKKDYIQCLKANHSGMLTTEEFKVLCPVCEKQEATLITLKPLLTDEEYKDLAACLKKQEIPNVEENKVCLICSKDATIKEDIVVCPKGICKCHKDCLLPMFDEPIHFSCKCNLSMAEIIRKLKQELIDSQPLLPQNEDNKMEYPKCCSCDKDAINEADIVQCPLLKCRYHKFCLLPQLDKSYLFKCLCGRPMKEIIEKVKQEFASEAPPLPLCKKCKNPMDNNSGIVKCTTGACQWHTKCFRSYLKDPFMDCDCGKSLYKLIKAEKEELNNKAYCLKCKKPNPIWQVLECKHYLCKSCFEKYIRDSNRLTLRVRKKEIDLKCLICYFFRLFSKKN